MYLLKNKHSFYSVILLLLFGFEENVTAEADDGIDGRGSVSDGGMSWNTEPAGRNLVGFYSDVVVHEMSVGPRWTIRVPACE